MKKFQQFRQKCAEAGMELTPDEAIRNYRITSELFDGSRLVSQLDLWKIPNVPGVDEKQKQELIHLIKYAKEPH